MSADRYGKLWSREELILAFELYCRIPFQKTKATNPDVRALAKMLQRSPASVARKLGNFGHFDPALRSKEISGLSHVGKLDREVWNEFQHDWSNLVLKAHELRGALRYSSDDVIPSIPGDGPTEKVVTGKARICQSFFRQTVLTGFGYTCCITGLAIAECLIASHIIPWRADERLRADPTNGLCLSATFHTLFDCGCICIDDMRRVKVAAKLRKQADAATETQILCWNGKTITEPRRFAPAERYLAWHRENVFSG